MAPLCVRALFVDHFHAVEILMLCPLQRGDRVAITIDTNDPPHHVLSIRGAAEVTETEGVVKEYRPSPS
jgi:hypothetical protein